MFTTIQNSFSAGELSPSVFGRTDLQKWHAGSSTMRNFWSNYRGGASSRAGTAWIGMCKQGAPNAGGTSTNNPPRDLPFQFNLEQGLALEFGDQYMRIKSQGAYVTEDPKNITAITQADPGVFTATAHGYQNGDWIFLASVGGMTSLNGLTYIVQNKTTDTFTLTDLFGDEIDTSSLPVYTTGGTASRIYTVVSPYDAIDLPFLKFTQSADTMSLTCINQNTNTDYPPYDLERLGATEWEFTEVTFASSIDAPTGVTATPQSSTTPNTFYSYTVTAVSADGEESVAATPGACENNDISINAGSNVITWDVVADATSYNVYGATPCYNAAVPAGVLYGFMGTSLSTSFVDNNIVADFTKVPPVHNDPFPSSGDFPAVVAYYQQRRVYASTLNNPDTYYMSQPGAFTNMDSSIPTTDSDSIVGAPWAQQINGIQFMVPMPSGFIILSGSGAWLVNGGTNAAITPADQTANPQSYNGCNNIVPPIVANFDILYVQSKGSIVRDLAYNFFVNVYTGTDTTVLSNHLFSNYKIIQWGYAEEPFKIIWAIRSDGVMLSFTYLKEQDVYAWARHDTNGLFTGACVITEPHLADVAANTYGYLKGPLTDALYLIVQRYVQGNWVYYAERMDDRNWLEVEDCWCVDAGLSYPMSFPDATLTPAAANGTNNITGTNLIFGGRDYTSPSLEVLDPTGQGTGFSATLTVVGGVITLVTINDAGQGYAQGTRFNIIDSTGSSGVISPLITNNVNFTASSSVFNSGMVGDVIRVGGGKATITSYTSPTVVVANITQEITQILQNNPENMPIPQTPGNWSVSSPVQTVSGLNHLNGMTVSILADGSVQPSQVVTDNSITLQAPYSQILIGLPFTAQLQTLYLDPPGQKDTPQGKRKDIQGVTIRMELSRGMSVGTNQPDASTQPNGATVTWTGMKEFKERNALINCGNSIPLFTGDEYIYVTGDWDELSQVAVQQTFPLPANVLAVIAWYSIGDTSG